MEVPWISAALIPSDTLAGVCSAKEEIAQISLCPFFLGVTSISVESIFLFTHLDYILFSAEGITLGSDNWCKHLAYIFIFRMDSSCLCKTLMTAVLCWRMLVSCSDLPERNRFFSGLVNWKDQAARMQAKERERGWRPHFLTFIGTASMLFHKTV